MQGRSYIPSRPLCDTGEIGHRVPHCDTMIRLGIISGSPNFDQNMTEATLLDDRAELELRRAMTRHHAYAMQDNLAIRSLEIQLSLLPGPELEAAQTLLDDLQQSDEIRTKAADDIIRWDDMAIRDSEARLTIKSAYLHMLRKGGCMDSSVSGRIRNFLGMTSCYSCPFAEDDIVQHAKDLLRSSPDLIVPEEWQNEESCE